MAGDEKPKPKTKDEGTPKKKEAPKKEAPKKKEGGKEKSPAKKKEKESPAKEEAEPAPAAAASPAKEDESLGMYMVAGIGEMLHGKSKKEVESDEDESNFLERGVNFLGELVDDIKAIPDRLAGPDGGRAEKTKVVRIISHLDQEGGGRTLAPMVLIDLVAAILEVPAKMIAATHERVVALAQIPIPKLIEELWRTVKKAPLHCLPPLLCCPHVPEPLLCC